MTRVALILWGLLLAVAPCAVAAITYEHRDGVLVISSAAGCAAAAVVVLFGLVVGRSR